SLSLLLLLPPPGSTLFPYTTLFRSPARGGQRHRVLQHRHHPEPEQVHLDDAEVLTVVLVPLTDHAAGHGRVLERHHAVQRALARSEEHTSELQSRENLVCRLLLEKK